MAKERKQGKVNSKVDELDQLTSTENFIDKYKKPIIIGAGAVVVIILGIVGYQKLIAGPHEDESKEVYWNAFYEFEQDSLNTAITGNENFDGMEDIANDFAGTSGGDIANYTLGVAAMRNADFQSAIDYFDECNFEDVVVGSILRGLKGDCYVELDDFQAAAEEFEKAASWEENEFTTPMYLKKAGLAYEALGDNSNALTVYQKIKDNWMSNTNYADIDKYIARAQN